jgi:hypothetical protein
LWITIDLAEQLISEVIWADRVHNCFRRSWSHHCDLILSNGLYALSEAFTDGIPKWKQQQWIEQSATFCRHQFYSSTLISLAFVVKFYTRSMPELQASTLNRTRGESKGRTI